MNESTSHGVRGAVQTESAARVCRRIARTAGFLRQEAVPLLIGSSANAKRNATKILVSWGCLALAVVLVSQPCSSGQRMIETRDWTLSQLVNHLHSHDLMLHVVPTYKSGSWNNSIYLTTDPEATWQSLQHKTRAIEKIDQWRGVVLIEHISNKPGPQWDVSQWGENGLQIDRFMLFGDAELIGQIGRSVIVAQPTCILSRLLCCH